jgi:hypothetical protein
MFAGVAGSYANELLYAYFLLSALAPLREIYLHKQSR